jgi:hypothetical protein
VELPYSANLRAAIAAEMRRVLDERESRRSGLGMAELPEKNNE